MKIITIVGARPQFIKAAVVSRCFSVVDSVNEIILHTGQHYDASMSKVFFDELQIPRPEYNLNIGGGTHGQNTGRMIEAIEHVLLQEKPDYVLVYGDTDSTLAGAIAAAKLHIPIAHVEAGLRSFNRRMPEELNRILTDHSSQLLFTPTDTATTNLQNEGIVEERVIQVGDVMQDAALFYQNMAIPVPGLDCPSGFILCTLHRAENTDDSNRLAQILAALNELAATRQVIVPVHPRTRKLLAGTAVDLSRLTLIEPVGYLSMIWLLKHCSLVLTDSGGLQKEAFFFGKFCITLRDETEWVELIQLGVNKLAGANQEAIVSLALQHYARVVSDEQQLYGGGKAGERIVTALLERRMVQV